MATELCQARFDRTFFGILGILGILAIFTVLVWLAFRASGPAKFFDEQRGQARLEKLAALQKENDMKLNHYAWLAKDQGTVRIPVTRAMELVAVDLKNKPVRVSTVPVEAKYPSGLQTLPAPVASASPAPNGSPLAPAPKVVPAASASPSAASTP